MGYLRNKIGKLRGNYPKILKLGLKIILGLFLSSFISVLLLRFIPVWVTPLMLIRCGEQLIDGKEIRLRKDWVPIEEISFNLQKSVISSEDPKFLEHNGFDFEAIAKAIEANKHRKVKIGASTITQQTAKNVFLYPSRTYIRKALEAYFTVMIELIWGKNRILEIYLNVIELGPGLYGAEAASLHFFKKSARYLTQSEAATLAAILPNPRKWNPVRPTNYVIKRTNFVHRNLRNIEPGYFQPLKEAQKPDVKKIDKKKKKKKKKTS